VGVDVEVRLPACLLCRLGERLLDVGGQHDVLETAAGRTHQVVVVLGELLGELVAGDVVGGREAPHDRALLERGEVAVQRALRLARTEVVELGDRHRAPGIDQQLHELAPPQRVALARPPQLFVDDVVDVGGHGPSIGHVLGTAVDRPAVSVLGADRAARPGRQQPVDSCLALTRPSAAVAATPTTAELLVRPSTRLLAAFAALLLLAVGCGDAVDGAFSGEAAATVDGETITRSQLEDAVRDLTADAPDDQREVAVEETQRQVLTLLIQAKIIENLADDEGIEVDQDAVDERYETDVEEAGGEEAFSEMLAFQSFTLDLYRDVLIPTQLRVDAMRQELAADEPDYETRTVRHILVETENEAQEILDELEAGEDFAELAEERSIDPGSGAEGGELGTFPRGAYVPEFDDAAWDAEIDEIVGPVETDFGFHIIQVTDEESMPATELDVQTLDELVGQELGMRINDAFQAAEIEVDPSLGRWDATAGEVVPTDRVGDGSDQQPTAPEGFGDQPEPGLDESIVEDDGFDDGFDEGELDE
jgi:foldase protein PrsA